MAIEAIVIRLAVSAVAGLAADLIVGEFRAGLLTAVFLGLLGALIGNWLFQTLGIPVGVGIIWELVVAFVGAAALIGILRLLPRRV